MATRQQYHKPDRPWPGEHKTEAIILISPRPAERPCHGRKAGRSSTGVVDPHPHSADETSSQAEQDTCQRRSARDATVVGGQLDHGRHSEAVYPTPRRARPYFSFSSQALWDWNLASANPGLLRRGTSQSSSGRHGATISIAQATRYTTQFIVHTTRGPLIKQHVVFNNHKSLHTSEARSECPSANEGRCSTAKLREDLLVAIPAAPWAGCSL